MNYSDKTSKGMLLISLFLLLFIIPAASQASVSYVFSVSEYPESPFHQPFQAELIFSDAAVDEGVADFSDIESLTISAGESMPELHPLTMSYLHPAFVNLRVLFSEDRETITSLSADITPHMSPTDHWVLYRPHPPSTELWIHEHLGYLSSHYVRLETTLLPVPPKYYFSYFTGEWQRYHKPFDFRQFMVEQAACFPFCPWPWLMILFVIFLAILFGIMKRGTSRRNH
jgi:hypothetical protein